jgi:creatinine amidohydrolase
MQWENLSTPQFAAAVEESAGVGIIAVGVLEPHSSHMPLGTDMFAVHHVAVEAAKREPAVVFPLYPFGINHEAYHLPGGVVFKRELVFAILENVCDEMARNGLKQIVLLSGHGGNRHFLPLFVQTLNERAVDYLVYYCDVPNMQGADELCEDTEVGHACEAETSTALALHPELVDMDAHAGKPFRNLRRNEALQAADVYSPVDWYAQYPTMTVGNGSLGTAEKGRLMIATRVDGVVKALRAIKDDEATVRLKEEYLVRKSRPTVPDYHA